jgi:hypothetical protein
VGAALPAAGSSFGQTGSRQAPGSNPTLVTVDENAPENIVHLGPVFGAMSGIQHGDGLQLSILGNTNSRLVKTDLSGTDLTLTYAPGKYGTAKITVGATDADGVSVQVTVLVTVRPILFTLSAMPADTGGAGPVPAGPAPTVASSAGGSPGVSAG